MQQKPQTGKSQIEKNYKLITMNFGQDDKK